jgi:hypothetical protein
LVIFPTGDAVAGANPEASVVRCSQREDAGVEQSLAVWRVPQRKVNAIEANQTGVRSNPQVTICGLCYDNRRSAKKSILGPPGRMGILGDAPIRIDCPRRACCMK